MEAVHAEPEVGPSEINHPVKMSRAFMTAADMKCAVYEGDRFETVICSQASSRYIAIKMIYQC
jgi:hypothetical protein